MRTLARLFLATFLAALVRADAVAATEPATVSLSASTLSGKTTWEPDDTAVLKVTIAASGAQAAAVALAGKGATTPDIQLEVRDAAGMLVVWNWIPNQTASFRPELPAGDRARFHFFLKPEGASKPAPGTYQLRARVTFTQPAQVVVSTPLEVTIAAPPGPVLTLRQEIIGGNILYAGWPALWRVSSTSPSGLGVAVPPETIALSVESTDGTSQTWPWQRVGASSAADGSPISEVLFYLKETETARLPLGSFRLKMSQAGTASSVSAEIRVAAPPATSTESDKDLEALQLHVALAAGHLEKARDLALAAYRAQPSDPANAWNLAEVALARRERDEALGWADLAEQALLPANPAEKAGPREYEAFGHDAIPEASLTALRALRTRILILPAGAKATTAAIPGTGSSAPATVSTATPPVPTPGPRIHWAVTAKAGSEYRNTQYSAAKATGAPDVPAHADNGNAWASKTPDGGEEWLELDFGTSLTVAEIRIVQSFNPGALVRVEGVGATGAALVLWTGPDATAYERGKIGELRIALATPARGIMKLKLILDTKRVPGWNEIDAVGIVEP